MAQTPDSQLLFQKGQKMVIPANADISPSNNAAKYPSTPSIAKVFVHKISNLIEFFPSAETTESPTWKRAGIFLHKDTHLGETVVELLWTTPTCAESRPWGC